MSTESGRKKFVESSIALLENHGFDGLDVDWEYPGDRNAALHYVELLRLLREALDASAAKKGAGCGFELTVAVASFLSLFFFG